MSRTGIIIAVAGQNGRRRTSSAGPAETTSHAVSLDPGLRHLSRLPVQAGSSERWLVNQSPASPAAASRVPGSSNRWLAPGTTARSFSQRSSAWALAVEVQDHLVVPADDEQRGRGHGGEPGPGEVGTAAAGYHGRDAGAGLGGRPQRRRGAGAGAEVADGGVCRARLAAQPAGHRGQPPGEQADVEHVGPVELLLGGEQVEQQRAQPGAVQDGGDMPVAGAVPAAAAAVGEDHDLPARSAARSGRRPARRRHPWGLTSPLKASGPAFTMFPVACVPPPPPRHLSLLSTPAALAGSA